MDDTIHGQKSRAAEHDVDALAERLIEVAGSKGEARRAIERAKAKGKKGRRRAFIKKIVGLCWPLPPTPKLSLGKDLIGCGNLGGANDNATVVDRLVARKSLWAALENEEGARRVFAEAPEVAMV